MEGTFFYAKAAHNGNGFHRPYRKAGRHFRGGQRAAALRAETAANIVLGLPNPVTTEIGAANQCGSNPAYVGAMVAVIKTGDGLLLRKVRHGEIGILEAGQQARARLQFLAGFQQMKTAAERKVAAQALGVAVIWDDLILPALEAAE
jgi:hypothetical protein